MGERQLQKEEMATSSAAVPTVSTQVQEVPAASQPVAVLTLRPAPRAESRRRVIWAEDTVDNEHMNKKKSKCCCIYEKPRKFGESDSEESDDECEHCFGHVEKRKQRPEDAQPSTSNDMGHSTPTSRTVKILVKNSPTSENIDSQPTPSTAT